MLRKILWALGHSIKRDSQGNWTITIRAAINICGCDNIKGIRQAPAGTGAFIRGAELLCSSAIEKADLATNGSSFRTSQESDRRKVCKMAKSDHSVYNWGLLRILNYVPRQQER